MKPPDGRSDTDETNEVRPPKAGSEQPVYAGSTPEEDGLVTKTVDAAVYGLSLPERVARAMVGTTSTIVRDTARVAVPDAFKQGRLYEITVRKMLGFLADDLGKLKQAVEDGDPRKQGDSPDDQFVVKKAVGNAVDVAGLAVFHVSPIWVIAILSDVVLGTKSYLNTLVTELKKEGVLPESETIDNVDALLDSLQKTSGALADNLDTPPITVDQLRSTVTKLRNEATRVNLAEVVSADDLARVWNEIEETVRLEGRSPLEVSSAVAMMTYSQMLRAGKGAYGTVKVALDLLSDNVIEHYFDAFQRIHEKGYYECILESYEQFVEDLRLLFDASAQTTTETIVRGRWLRRCWGWLKSK